MKTFVHDDCYVSYVTPFVRVTILKSDGEACSAMIVYRATFQTCLPKGSLKSTIDLASWYN